MRAYEQMNFYMTWMGKYADALYPIIQHNEIPIMRNSFHRWSDAKGEFLPLTHAPTHGNLIIDSGGFNALAHGHTSHPWTVKQYHEWLQSVGPAFEWAAVMDYACEERFDDVLTKEERMRQTLENTIAHYSLDPDYKALPVLQGRCLHDYLRFYDWLQDHGIPTDHVGLGTVCRLNSEKEIKRLEQGLRANTDIERLHGFGIKINAFRHGALFETADSNAWNMEPSNGNIVYDDGDRLRVERMAESSDAQHRSVRSFMEYYKYASRLQNQAKKMRGQTSQQLLSGYAAD